MRPLRLESANGTVLTVHPNAIQVVQGSQDNFVVYLAGEREISMRCTGRTLDEFISEWAAAMRDE